MEILILPLKQENYSSHDLIRFSQFLFLSHFHFSSRKFSFLPLRNDCIKHIIFPSSTPPSVCVPRAEKTKEWWDVWTSMLVIIFLFDTYEKQFSLQLPFLPYIIMYLMPRWLQCRVRKWKWMRRKSSVRRYLIIHFYMLH